MRNWLRKKTINILVHNLFRGVMAEEILHTNKNGNIIYKGQVLDKASKEIIISQAKQIDDMLLWKILNDEMIYRAEEKMFKKSTDYNGLMFGKALLFMVEEQAKRIKFLKKIK